MKMLISDKSANVVTILGIGVSLAFGAPIGALLFIGARAARSSKQRQEEREEESNMDYLPEVRRPFHRLDIPTDPFPYFPRFDIPEDPLSTLSRRDPRLGHSAIMHQIDAEQEGISSNERDVLVEMMRTGTRRVAVKRGGFFGPRIRLEVD